MFIIPIINNNQNVQRVLQSHNTNDIIVVGVLSFLILAILAYVVIDSFLHEKYKG